MNFPTERNAGMDLHQDTRTETELGGDGIVRRHLAIATTAFEAATCGHPLCRIGDGPDVMRPKFAEGSLVAVRELDRSLGRSPAADPADLATETLGEWEEERRSCQDHGGPRVAYLNGGIAQLRAILSELQGHVAVATA